MISLTMKLPLLSEFLFVAPIPLPTSPTTNLSPAAMFLSAILALEFLTDST